MDHTQDIRNFIVNNFLFGDGSQLQNDTSFMRSGIIDSTGILELITHLETTHGISIENPEMLPENLDSIDRVNGFLLRKIAAKTS